MPCLLASAELGHAQVKVQPPGKASVSKQRALQVRQARAQRVAPLKVRSIAREISGALKNGKALIDVVLRKQVSNAPLASRLLAFQEIAKSQGHEVQSFQRRFRGLLKAGKTSRVSRPKKTVFEVLPGTLDLFRQTMGENVIWFAANSRPGHLHTLLADQDGGPKLTHNTYGTNFRDATITQTQYMAPVQLDRAQMARFTKYLNTGASAARKSEVYGFKSSSGKMVCDVTCTNWATLGSRRRLAPLGSGDGQERHESCQGGQSGQRICWGPARSPGWRSERRGSGRSPE